MASFDRTTIQFIQNLHFHRKLLKCDLGFIPSFVVKMDGMNTKVDDTSSNPRWDFLTSVPFKTLITQHQDQLTLRNTKNK